MDSLVCLVQIRSHFSYRGFSANPTQRLSLFSKLWFLRIPLTQNPKISKLGFWSDTKESTEGGRCDAHFCIFLCPLKCLDKSRGGSSVSNSLLTYFKGAKSQKIVESTNWSRIDVVFDVWKLAIGFQSSWPSNFEIDFWGSKRAPKTFFSGLCDAPARQLCNAGTKS